MFEQSLERMRVRYGFFVSAYVVMPEHVHLLVSELREVKLAVALQALKVSVAVRSEPRPFWSHRYYDFNLWGERKVIEQGRYVHRNPMKRGLVWEPDEWRWSSFRHWSTGEVGAVEVESPWTAQRRGGLEMRLGMKYGCVVEAHLSEARRGAPRC